MNFTSDNAYGAAPEILAALADGATGTAAPYGEDAFTGRVTRALSEIFEREVAVFPVVTGTAANALALATVAPPYGAIFCHAQSHIAVDECAAPEFFSGGAKLVHLEGTHGKITPATVDSALTHYRGGVHSPGAHRRPWHVAYRRQASKPLLNIKSVFEVTLNPLLLAVRLPVLAPTCNPVASV
jgi:threonine aldolase